MYEELKNAENKVVRLKNSCCGAWRREPSRRCTSRTTREEHVKERVLHAIGEMEIHIVNVETMKRELWKAACAELKTSSFRVAGRLYPSILILFMGSGECLMRSHWGTN